MSGTPSFRCTFYLRHPVEGGPRYSMIDVPGPGFRTPMPPSVDDLIYLSGTGVVRVIARQFMPASWGSPAWSREDICTPTSVDIIVVPDEGVFADEAPLTAEEMANG